MDLMKMFFETEGNGSWFKANPIMGFPTDNNQERIQK